MHIYTVTRVDCVETPVIFAQFVDQTSAVLTTWPNVTGTARYS